MSAKCVVLGGFGSPQAVSKCSCCVSQVFLLSLLGAIHGNADPECFLSVVVFEASEGVGISVFVVQEDIALQIR